MLCVQDSVELTAYIYDMFLASLSTHSHSPRPQSKLLCQPEKEGYPVSQHTHNGCQVMGIPQDYCNMAHFWGVSGGQIKSHCRTWYFLEIPLSDLLVSTMDGSKGIALKQTRWRINSAQGCVLSFAYMEFLKACKISSLLCYLKSP